MSAFSESVVRLVLDTRHRGMAVDANTGDTPSIWRGAAARFDWALFFGEDLKSVGKLSSVSLEVKPKDNRLGRALMSSTVSGELLNDALLLDNWQAGSDQHGTFRFAADLTALDLGGKNEEQFWLVISALTNDVPARRVTLDATLLTIVEDGTPVECGGPPQGPNLVPVSSHYDSDGHFTLETQPGKVYLYIPGPNDFSVTNGVQTIDGEGHFVAQGTSIILNGANSALITAVIWFPAFFTRDESDARYHVLASDEGIIVKSLVAPDAANVSFFRRCLWLDLNPTVALKYWNDDLGQWDPL